MNDTYYLGVDWNMRQKIAGDCHRMLLAGLLVLDTETTGLSDDAEICEISIIADNGASLINTLIRTEQPITAEATAINGITDEMLAEAPTFPEVYARLRQIIGHRKVVIYNAQFDHRMMEQVCQRHHLPPLLDAKQCHCLMLDYADFHGEWDPRRQSFKWPKLTAACEQMGIEWDGTAHRAPADTHMTLALMRAMATGDAQQGGAA